MPVGEGRGLLLVLLEREGVRLEGAVDVRADLVRERGGGAVAVGVLPERARVRLEGVVDLGADLVRERGGRAVAVGVLPERARVRLERGVDVRADLVRERGGGALLAPVLLEREGVRCEGVVDLGADLVREGARGALPVCEARGLLLVLLQRPGVGLEGVVHRRADLVREGGGVLLPALHRRRVLCVVSEDAGVVLDVPHDGVARVVCGGRAHLAVELGQLRLEAGDGRDDHVLVPVGLLLAHLLARLLAERGEELSARALRHVLVVPHDLDAHVRGAELGGARRRVVALLEHVRELGLRARRGDGDGGVSPVERPHVLRSVGHVPARRLFYMNLREFVARAFTS